MTIRIIEVGADDARAVALREMLDSELDQRYGSHTESEPAEVTAARVDALRVHPDQIVGTWLALDKDDGRPLGQVILRRLGDEWELKRLIVAAWARRRGVGSALTRAVLDRARREGAQRVILQTGASQPESVALYVAAGFVPIPVFEPYVATMPDSLCFALRLDDDSAIPAS